MPKISNEKLFNLFLSGGSQYPLYAETVKVYNELRIHAEGDYPTKLIDDRRPSEPEEIKAYREKNYHAITKLPVSKVINCYSKIRRSPDWMIKFPANTNTAIKPEETLEYYCTNSLPGVVSLTNWGFDVLLDQNLIDPNAWVLVVPTNQISDLEYVRPVPIVFNSDHVMYVDEVNKWGVFKSRVKVSYTDLNNNPQFGDRFMYLDDAEFTIYEQTKDGYTPIFSVTNVTGQFTAFKVKSKKKKQFDNMCLQESRMSAMVPFLNKAAAGDSDLDGSKIQHLYPLFWYFQNNECEACNGLGKNPPAEGSTSHEHTTCKSCAGKGKIPFSPFAHITVNASSFDKQQAPTPPAGYVTRDTEILKLQDEMNDKNIFKALSAMNMEFLNQTPLSISGDAKNVDREELNNTVFVTAEDIVYALDKAVNFINEWRNYWVVKDPVERKKMLPNIPVPQNFDLLPADYLMNDLTTAITGKVSPLIISTMQVELVQKKFYNDPALATNLTLSFSLDPLPGLTIDDKMALLSNTAITQQDFVISSYLPAFIQRAVREHNDKAINFASMDYVKQMEVLTGYAQEKITATDEAKKMIEQQKQKEMEAAAALKTGI